MSNEEQNPASYQTAVSSRHELVKMKHRDTNDHSIFSLWHLLNESKGEGSEYTLCGLATTDSNMTFEDYEAEEYKRGGKITCPDCLKMLNWCKSVE
ncbi:MAG TPA: hypothetical protein VIL57_04620 [Bacteroidia bacterium]